MAKNIQQHYAASLHVLNVCIHGTSVHKFWSACAAPFAYEGISCGIQLGAVGKTSETITAVSCIGQDCDQMTWSARRMLQILLQRAH